MITLLIIINSLTFTISVFLWFFLSRTSKKNAEQKGLLDAAGDRLKDLQDDLTKTREDLLEITIKASQEETRRKDLEDLAYKYQETVKLSIDAMKSEFKLTANCILEEKSKTFSNDSKTKIAEFLKPLQDTVNDFQKATTAILKETCQDQTTLKNLIKPLGDQVDNFTKALKGDFKVQGDLGEIILEKLFEQAGLIKDTHYSVQSHDMELITDEEEKIRPDFIVHLPENKKIIIDSKVSIKHFIDYFSTEDTLEKEALILKQLESIKNHIKNLGEKNYPSSMKASSLEFVVLCVPHDHALMAALRQEPDLQSFAMSKKVWLSSPTLLIPMLYVIKDLWRKDNLDKNVEGLSKVAGQMHDRLAGFLKKFSDIKTRADSLTDLCEDAARTLQGPRGVLKCAEKLKELGAKTSKEIAYTAPAEHSSFEDVILPI